MFCTSKMFGKEFLGRLFLNDLSMIGLRKFSHQIYIIHFTYTQQTLDLRHTHTHTQAVVNLRQI